MNRRGFALLTVLWLVTLLAALGATALGVARRGADASRNRIALLHAGWAREACLEIALGRTDGGPPAPLDSVDLGRGSWCRLWVDNPAAKLDLNVTDPLMLRAVLGDDSLADALLDWRDGDDLTRPAGAERDWYFAQRRPLPRNGPLADVEELSLVRGFERRSDLAALFTARGAGQLDLNAAPLRLLAVLPGMSPEALAAIAYRRSVGRPLTGVEDLAAHLTAEGRRLLLNEYQRLAGVLVPSTPAFIATAEGRVGGSGVRASVRATLVPAGARLAVVAREAW